MVWTYSGKTNVRDLITGRFNANISHISWGAGSMAAFESDLALGSELFASGASDTRNAVDSFRYTKERVIVSGKLFADQLVNGSLFEIALSTASSGGSMLTRQDYAQKIKTDTLALPTDWYLGVDQL